MHAYTLIEEWEDIPKAPGSFFFLGLRFGLLFTPGPSFTATLSLSAGRIFGGFVCTVNRLDIQDQNVLMHISPHSSLGQTKCLSHVPGTFSVNLGLTQEHAGEKIPASDCYHYVYYNTVESVDSFSRTSLTIVQLQITASYINAHVIVFANSMRLTCMLHSQILSNKLKCIIVVTVKRSVKNNVSDNRNNLSCTVFCLAKVFAPASSPSFFPRSYFLFVLQ